jgi:hypothetical protein
MAIRPVLGVVLVLLACASCSCGPPSKTAVVCMRWEGSKCAQPVNGKDLLDLQDKVSGLADGGQDLVVLSEESEVRQAVSDLRALQRQGVKGEDAKRLRILADAPRSPRVGEALWSDFRDLVKILVRLL